MACKCKQSVTWYVEANMDEDSMLSGYDGDIDDNIDTSEWHAYQLIAYRECDRCGNTELMDSLGAVWVTPADLTYDVLRNTIVDYGMVPKNVRAWEIRDYLA